MYQMQQEIALSGHDKAGLQACSAGQSRLSREQKHC